MIPSPPQEAAYFRGENLEPVSPKPAHYPSPSNIPILEKQMDPLFLEQPAHIGQVDDSNAHENIEARIHDGTNYGQNTGTGTIAEPYQPAFNLEMALSNQQGATDASQAAMSMTANISTPTSATLPTLPNLNLPPRPPPQEKPATHPNYAPEDDIRSYHPHSQNQKMPGAASVDAENSDEDDVPWPRETQTLYDQFLVDERTNVTEGQWDKFPNGSRLFIGNLPTEKVTKRDLFHVFHKHGKLAQISLKQAYGFVQFLDTESCRRALAAEQNFEVRGRKMHLEISKPQRNTGNAAKNEHANRQRGNQRRSRSPDHNRGGGQQRGVDRYTGGQGSPRGREFRRSRDDYRPARSPSPRGGGRRNRSRDRFRQSPSRSPPGRHGGRYRSPSPQRGMTDDLPLPRRAPQDVPDLQIIVLGNLDRKFVTWVDQTFKGVGVKVDVLLLSPRLREDAVIRRQIVEGVLAVSRLTKTAEDTGKIPLQIFDRSAGADNVRFDEYADLDVHIAAQLVLRDKQKQASARQPQYGLPAGYSMPAATHPPYGAPPVQQQQPPTPGLPPNISSVLQAMGPGIDSTQLSQLMNAMNQQNQQAAHAPLASPASTAPPDLSQMFRSPIQQQAPVFSSQAQPNQYANYAAHPGFASMMQQGAPGQPGTVPQYPTQGANGPPNPLPSNPPTPSAPNMSDLMAKLAQYQR